METLAKTTLWEKIQTLIVVTIIAALVWLYAEDENIKDYPNEVVDVKFVAPTGKTLLIEPSTPQRIRVSVRASQGQFAQFQRDYQSAPLEIVVNDNPGSDDPVQQVVLRDALLANSKISSMGLSVTDTQPTIMPVTVEALRKVELPVRLDAGDAQLVGTPIIDPATASISLPGNLAQKVENQAMTVMLSDVPNLASLPDGVAHTVEQLPIHTPKPVRNYNPNLKPQPAVAKLTFTIRKQTDTLTLTTVPVLVLLPPSALGTYTVKINEVNYFVHDVSVAGPSDTVAKIKAGELRVSAVLALSAEELDKAITAKELRFDLPTGVSVTSTIPRLEFTITKPAPTDTP
ncbi:MAG: hypothetical protein GC164_15085 [Phycisphaera sp.]|nr:hypothetical protein [Phycisphaera sp.]